MPAVGGPVSAIAGAGNPRGGTWGPDNTIVFDPDFQGVLYRVGAEGGTPTAVTKLDSSKHTTHRWPWFLPDGKHFLYLATNHNGGNPADNGIYYASLDGKENRFLVPSDSGAQYANGYLLYHSQNALMAQAFDPGSGKLQGDAVPIVDKVRQDSGIWRSTFSASQNGMLLYQNGAIESGGSQLVWFDRSGKDQKPLTERGPYVDMRIAPDGKRVAVSYGDPTRQIWILDTERGSKTRLTFDESVKNSPSWSPDGKTLVYQANSAAMGTTWQIRSKAANGSGEEAVLLSFTGAIGAFPSLSPDGQYVVYLYGTGPTGWAITAKPLTGESKPFTVVAPPTSQTNIQNFRISPNGRWVAYASNESGGSTIYVTSFPHSSGKWQVSTDVGDFPTWRADGKKLYFIRYTDDIIYECDITETAGEIQIGPPQPLFRANVSAIGASFDASADGNRFLVDVAQQEAATPLSLVVNWPAELKKK